MVDTIYKVVGTYDNIIKQRPDLAEDGVKDEFLKEVYKRVGYQNINKTLLQHDIDLDLSTRDFMTLINPEGKVRIVYRGAKDAQDWELVKATIKGDNQNHPELKKVDEHIQKVFEKYGKDNVIEVIGHSNGGTKTHYVNEKYGIAETAFDPMLGLREASDLRGRTPSNAPKTIIRSTTAGSSNIALGLGGEKMGVEEITIKPHNRAVAAILPGHGIDQFAMTNVEREQDQPMNDELKAHRESIHNDAKLIDAIENSPENMTFNEFLSQNNIPPEQRNKTSKLWLEANRSAVGIPQFEGGEELTMKQSDRARLRAMDEDGRFHALNMSDIMKSDEAVAHEVQARSTPIKEDILGRTRVISTTTGVASGLVGGIAGEQALRAVGVKDQGVLTTGSAVSGALLTGAVDSALGLSTTPAGALILPAIAGAHAGGFVGNAINNALPEDIPNEVRGLLSGAGSGATAGGIGALAIAGQSAAYGAITGAELENLEDRWDWPLVLDLEQL
jgi:hypothetical protein